ncbi:MAG: hypothetical protein ACTSRK_12275 [Promethearchaeota archaeon]
MAGQGEWVILKNDEIIERDKELSKILDYSKKYDVKTITISKIPSSNYCFY